MNFGIGLLGCGTVGSAVAEELANGRLKNCTLKKVLVKNTDKKRPVNQSYLTNSIDEIINNSEINIVIELLGNEEPAHTYVSQCMKAGKHIVTANKELIAKHGPKLLKEAKDNNVNLRFEAAVAGGIPVINAINHDLSANNIQEVVGILNGTTNYILSEMAKGQDFKPTLNLAKEKGYAEPDPTNDIEGYDVRYKTSILATLAFGQYISPENIPCKGITKVSSNDFEFAHEMGYNIKLLGLAKKSNNNLSVDVHSYLVPLEHPLAKIDNVLNAVSIRADLVGELLLVGPGAGPQATTSAILADTVNITAGTQSNLCFGEANNLSIAEDCHKTYIRLVVKDELGVMGDIGHTLAKQNISLESVIQKKNTDNTVYLSMLTHEITESQLNKALESIQKHTWIKEVSSILKVFS